MLAFLLGFGARLAHVLLTFCTSMLGSHGEEHLVSKAEKAAKRAFLFEHSAANHIAGEVCRARVFS